MKTLFILITLFASMNTFSQKPAVNSKKITAPGKFLYSTTSSFNLATKEEGEHEIFTYAYDEKGNRIRKEYDDEFDGKPNWIHTYRYDAKRNLTREERDNNLDGIPDKIYTYKYEYDVDGNIRREEKSRKNKIFLFFYKHLYEIITYTYDANGNNTKKEFDRKDKTFFFSRKHSYSSVNYKYDPNGNMTRAEHGANGTIYGIYVYTYDANGNRVREENYDGDGSTNWILTYAYNSNGNKIREEADYSGKGTLDEVSIYIYDDSGNKIRVEKDENGDGNFNWIYTYTYDDKGNMTRVELDADRDVDYISNYVYDSNGNMIKEKFDWNRNGDYEVKSYTYDINGNEIREEQDRNGDGNADRIYNSSYTNYQKCVSLSNGLVHQLLVHIPEDGQWEFSLCGTSFQNYMALSAVGFCEKEVFMTSDGCTDGNTQATANLMAGDYYLTVGGKNAADKGNYSLNIKKSES